MAYKNLIDDTSTTVSTTTPGVTLDLRYHSTLSRVAQGVPVRFKVCALNGIASDTGAVKLVDANGIDVITCPINGAATETWYTADGYLPTTLAKYDPQYGGNTLGSLTVYAFSLYELARFDIQCSLTATLTLTLTATGTTASRVQPHQTMLKTSSVYRGYHNFTGDFTYGELHA